MIKSGNKEPSKSTSWKVLETVMSHLKGEFYGNLYRNFLPFSEKCWCQHFCWDSRLVILKKVHGQFFFVDSNSPCRDLFFPCGPTLKQKSLNLVGIVPRKNSQAVHSRARLNRTQNLSWSAENHCHLTNPINKTFTRLILLRNSTFLDTLMLGM